MYIPLRHYICAITSKHLLLHTVTHELQENLTLWPGGMKSFADYLHSKGMQLSVYTDAGTRNCCGYICSDKLKQIELDASRCHASPNALCAFKTIFLLVSLALLDTKKST